MLGEVVLNEFQLELMAAVHSGAPIVAVAGAWGCGKTAGEAIAADCLLNNRPGARAIWVTDTGDRRDRVIVPEIEKFFLDSRHFKQEQRIRFRRTRADLWLINYFRPGTRTAETNSLEGPTINVGLIDEAQTYRQGVEVAKKLRGRLRQPIFVNGRRAAPVQIITGLPITDAWWVKYAEDNGGIVLRPNSFVNRANLDADWLRQAEAELDEDEIRAFLYGESLRPKGQILDNWVADEWPKGNLLTDWRYDPDMPTDLIHDPGFNRPTGVLIQHDPERQVDVIFGEVMPVDMSVGEFVDEVHALAWPRQYEAWRPGGVPHWYDDLTIDPAGRQRDRQTRLSDVDVLAAAPHIVDESGNGLGLYPYFDTDPIRLDIEGSLLRLRRRIHFKEQRRLVMHRPLWDRGNQGPERRRSLARCIQRHKRLPDGRIPMNDGYKDGIDCLRYWARRRYWFEHPLDGRMPSLSGFDARPQLRDAWEDR